MSTDPAILNELELLRRRVAELLETVAALKAENAELRRRLGMDSSNSSKPPSTDSPFKRPPPTPPSARKPGGQPGHPGEYRRLATEPDIVEPVKPSACAHCGGPLGEADLLEDPWVHEVVDIEVQHHVRRIERFAAQCPACKKRTRAKAPAGTPVGSFGPSLEAAVGLLTMHGVSRGDVQKFLKALFGLDISIGAIDQIGTRVAASATDAVEDIARHIEASAVAHADETGWHVRGKLGWIWAALAGEAELFRFDKKRNGDAMKLLLRNFQGILHSDRWKPYEFYKPENRQLCHAHLRRDLQALIDLGGDMGEVAKRMLALSDEMFAVWRAFDRAELDAAQMKAKIEEVKTGWKADAALLTRATGRPRALGRSLLKLWPALWNFAEYPGVVPTNNAQEQAVRKVVKVRKNSFGSTSVAGAERTATLLTVLGTARRGSFRLFDWMADALDRRNRGLPGALLLGVAPNSG